MTYQAPADLVTAHPIPQMIPLIEANVRRFEAELRSGYDNIKSNSQSNGVAISCFESWAFMLVDQVFRDMLEAEADHTSPVTYTEEIGRRLGMKIKQAMTDAAGKR